MTVRYEYHVHELPNYPGDVQNLLNLEGEDGFEFGTWTTRSNDSMQKGAAAAHDIGG